MSREQVLEIVGDPPGDYTGHGATVTLSYPSREYYAEDRWIMEVGVLQVFYDENAVVLDIRRNAARGYPQRLIDRIRDCLGL
jgi:hypothetical protein